MSPFPGDLLDDATHDCHITLSFVTMMWGLILFMGFALALDAGARVRGYLRQRTTKHTRGRSRSLARDAVFRILVLIGLVGAVFGLLALSKLLSSQNAVGETAISTILYCVSWTVFPTLSFQLIWTWVTLVCKSSLGQEAKMAVLLRKLKTGFIATWFIVLIAAWVPMGMLLHVDTKVKVCFASVRPGDAPCFA